MDLYNIEPMHLRRIYVQYFIFNNVIFNGLIFKWLHLQWCKSSVDSYYMIVNSFILSDFTLYGYRVIIQCWPDAPTRIDNFIDFFYGKSKMNISCRLSSWSRRVWSWFSRWNEKQVLFIHLMVLSCKFNYVIEFSLLGIIFCTHDHISMVPRSTT
jgi:hypothetical protein